MYFIAYSYYVFSFSPPSNPQTLSKSAKRRRPTKVSHFINYLGMVINAFAYLTYAYHKKIHFLYLVVLQSRLPRQMRRKSCSVIRTQTTRQRLAGYTQPTGNPSPKWQTTAGSRLNPSFHQLTLHVCYTNLLHLQLLFWTLICHLQRLTLQWRWVASI